MIKMIIVSIISIVPLTANAVYKCTTPQVNGSNSSGITYSTVPCATDAEKLDVEESEYRKHQIDAEIANKKAIKEAKAQEEYRIWKEQEPIRLQNEIIRLRQRAESAEDAASSAKLELHRNEVNQSLNKIYGREIYR